MVLPSFILHWIVFSLLNIAFQDTQNLCPSIYFVDDTIDDFIHLFFLKPGAAVCLATRQVVYAIYSDCPSKTVSKYNSGLTRYRIEELIPIYFTILWKINLEGLSTTFASRPVPDVVVFLNAPQFHTHNSCYLLEPKLNTLFSLVLVAYFF